MEQISREIKTKGLKLESWSAENIDKPGLNRTNIYLQFSNFEENDLNVDDKFTTNPRSGQYLTVKEVEDNKVTCKLLTQDNESWLSGQDLINNVEYYKL